MPRYKITVAYDGEPYMGWQTQPGGQTVQDVLTAAMEQVLGEKIQLTGAGRTDAGVHAGGQAAHFDVSRDLDLKAFLWSMYGVLPRAIAVTNAWKVSDEFHARFHASARRYCYQILRDPNPLYYKKAWEQFRPLDTARMCEAAALFLGEHDFLSFCRRNPDQRNTMCTITHSGFEESGILLSYRIHGNRFLHHMVRRIIGTLVEVGLGKRSVQEVRQLLEEPGKSSGGPTAPARGLILEEVNFPDETLKLSGEKFQESPT